MVATLTEKAIEQSTYVITVAFLDEDDNAITPISPTWTLTDESGGIINEQADNAIPPATTATIVLSGDDLAVSGTHDTARILTVSGTYNSAAGAGLPFRDHIRFLIEGVFA